MPDKVAAWSKSTCIKCRSSIHL